MLKNKNFYFVIIILLLLTVLTAFSGRYATATVNGIKLWASAILPTLFPYLVLTSLLTSIDGISRFSNKLSFITQKLFNCSGVSLYAFFLSVLTGYPVGSKTVAELYQKKMIGSGEATRIAILCSTSSPIFILGTIGTIILNNTFLGVIIFVAHILSSLLTAVCFRSYGDKTNSLLQPLPTKKADNIIYEAIYSSVISVLVVGGFITFFFILCEIITDFNLLYPLEFLFSLIFNSKDISFGLSIGLIECTKGLSIIGNANITPLSLALIGFIISFGGLSVIMQSSIYLKKAKIKIAVFLIAKFIQAIFCFLIIFIICCLL